MPNYLIMGTYGYKAECQFTDTIKEAILAAAAIENNGGANIVIYKLERLP